jgi:Zn-dependent M28 family amino/carboxypeptidase
LGWIVKREAFSDITPKGNMSFVNLRARFAPDGGEIDWNDGGGMVLVCSHYDTKIMDGIRFDGANDGGSSTGVLIEMAKALAAAPAIAKGIELVFFDGEEAVIEFTEVDGLYGSRRYAKQWRSAPGDKKPVAAFVLDLVGDSQLRIDPPSDSPSHLLLEVYAAAEELGHRSIFGRHTSPITDDHVPLNAAGIPALDLIDAGYITRGRWHTERDTLDSVSAESLQIIGDVMLRVLEKRHRETL